LIVCRIGVGREVSEGHSELNAVLLTKGYPKLSKVRSLEKGIEVKRGASIIRNIAS